MRPGLNGQVGKKEVQLVLLQAHEKRERARFRDLVQVAECGLIPKAAPCENARGANWESFLP